LPLIIDESLGVGSNALASQLRSRGFNARSVKEIFGTGRIDDIDIRKLAEQIGGRVVASDRGRDLAGGFGRLTVKIPQRSRRTDSVVRLIDSILNGPGL